jgi:hypothetical protein
MAPDATKVRRRGSVNHLAWVRMTAEFLPFFPIAIKPLIALGVDTSSPSFTRFGLHRLLISSERLKRARTFATRSKPTPSSIPNSSGPTAAIGSRQVSTSLIGGGDERDDKI